MDTKTLTVEQIAKWRNDPETAMGSEYGALTYASFEALCDLALSALRSQARPDAQEPPTLDECFAAGKGPEQMDTFREGGLPNTPEERARFEAYMRGHCWSIGEYSDDKQCYDTVLVRMLYGVWRDRGALGEAR